MKSKRTFTYFKFVVILALWSIVGSISTAMSQPNIISGIYQANDGGFYYVRFVGDARGGSLFWLGERPDGSFSNVMVGQLNVFPGIGNTFSVTNGEWWDVPKGRANGASSQSRPNTLLNLAINSTSMAKSFTSGVGFGGATWIKINHQPPRAPSTLRPGFTGTGATGVWLGNDGGIYYIRQTGPVITWFGQACSGGSVPNFANVFKGDISGTRATGPWADLPYGRNNGAGNLTVQITPTVITRTTATGGFGGSSWIRSSALAATRVTSLMITITTGGDVLRGGAVAYGSIELRGGRALPKVNLNGGRGAAMNTTQSFPLPLTTPIRLGDLVSFTLEQDGSPRNLVETYNNWDVDTVQIQAVTPSGRFCLACRSGAPFVRLTGEKTFERIPFALP